MSIHNIDFVEFMPNLTYLILAHTQLQYIDPITEMTWLKNLWVINCNSGVSYQMTQALPNTKVQGAGNATVASGWRNLPNYYAMRDALGMYYMSWD